MRATIDYGIDLGTTNSVAARMEGNRVEVIRNFEGQEFTPSAVHIDKDNQVRVGRTARERFEFDEANTACEFKKEMGTAFTKRFQRSGRKLNPEELSAEVLKSLKADVKHQVGEEINATVITVPAAFDLPQNQATDKAAQLAGFKQAPLLQEPVAAALAYGFDSLSDKVFWMVYDFGGGTFDAAVIQIRDEMIQVVNHGGHNRLGGSLIDWAIVEELLVPALTQEYRLSDFHRGNHDHVAAFAKLKLAAERAKIRLSRYDSESIEIENLCQDYRGNPVRFEYQLKKNDLESLAAPFIRQTINIAKKVLEDKRLQFDHLEKILLVGGVTLMPFVRQSLLDPREGLGIPLEYNIDPITVVARGAALFAGTQRLETISWPISYAPGKYRLELEYEPMGSDPEPLVAGRVKSDNRLSFAGFALEFINTSVTPPWHSGRINLTTEGNFMTRLFAVRSESNSQNLFTIALYDSQGTTLETAPEQFTYTIGRPISDPILTHSVGVSMANNELDVFFEKGTPLPVRKRSIHKTAYEVKQGQDGSLIRIPIMEGENRRRADRNRFIGALEIPAMEIHRDLPVGCEVEIIIEMDKSRLVCTKAYIPLLDEEFEKVFNPQYQEPDRIELRKKVTWVKDRFAQLRRQAEDLDHPKAKHLLDKIGQEQIVKEIDSALAAAGVGQGDAHHCHNRLLDFQSLLDEVEEAMEWPQLLKDAEYELERINDVAKEFGTPEDKRRAEAEAQEVRRMMDTRDADLLRRSTEEMRNHKFNILFAQKGFWAGIFRDLENKKDKMSDRGQAETLFSQGQRAINGDDFDGLKESVRGLWKLLPQSEAPAGLSDYIGTTIRS